jgi:enoyl-CoA hydratase/carnithine racemase
MIDVATKDSIAVLTLAHGKANALDIEFCDAIASRLDTLRDAKAIILTGQDKIFSAGVDLKRISEGGADYVRNFLPALHRLYEAAFFHPKPIVAAINGHAIAGGCVLALCADRRVMANDGGRMGVTELLVGVPFPALAFEIMRQMTPPYFFAETILSGATFPAEQAAHRGWVNEAAESARLMEQALAAAQSLAALSPAAFAQTKQQIRAPVIERLALSGDVTDKAVTEVWAAPETLRYIRDYVARTLKKS